MIGEEAVYQRSAKGCDDKMAKERAIFDSQNDFLIWGYVRHTHSGCGGLTFAG